MRNERVSRVLRGLLSAGTLAALLMPVAGAQTDWAARCSGMSGLDGASAEIADRCEAVATDQFSYSLSGAQKALALYHAADASFGLGIAGDTERLKRSASQIDASLSQLPNFSPFFSQNPHDPGAEQNKKACKGSRKSRECKARAAEWQASADRVQYDRAVLKVRSYKALAEALESNPAAGFNAACSSKPACIESALAFLTGQSAVVGPYEAKVGEKSTPEGPEVARFNILRADLLEFRGRPADRSEALSIYEEIATRGVTTAERNLAKAKVETLALKLGDEAAAGFGTAQASVQGLNDADRYFQRALAVNAGSYRAASGKASVLQVLAGLTIFPVPERRSYYRQAESAWVRAAGLASGGDRAESAFQLGRTRAELAALIGSVQPVLPVDEVERKSLLTQAVAEFENAVAIDPKAEYLFALANSKSALNPSGDASAYYRQAVATLLGYDTPQNWSVPATTQAHAKFKADVERLDPGARQAVTDALLALGDSENALLAAESAEKDPVRSSIRLAELYMRSGRKTDAATKLQSVLRNTQTDSGAVPAGAENDRAKAFFLRSRLYDPAGKVLPTKQNITDADDAYRLKPSEEAYKDWACSIRIIAGGEYVRNRNGDISCLVLASEQREVLHGMFLLRAAQYAWGQDQLDLRNQARAWFRAGHERLKTRADYDRFQGRFYTEKDELRALRPLLLYGEALAVACSGASQKPDITNDELKAATDLFAAFRVASCSR